jgi:hypothetical protein
MKKQTIMISAALLLMSSAVFATPTTTEKTNRAVVQSKPENTLSGKIRFSKNDTAPKDTGGIDSSRRETEFSKLPVSVQYAVKNQYANFEPNSKVIEYVFEGKSTYYITVENSSRVIDLRYNPDGEMTVESNVRKKN